jgi:GNAT superfamily N-acetyltransferase
MRKTTEKDVPELRYGLRITLYPQPMKSVKMSNIVVRSASAADVETILTFIKGLAAFEKEPDAVKTTTADLLRDGFGANPKFEVLIAEQAGQPVGFALFFPTYSTWEGRPGIYLEDLFVVEEARKFGVGRKLMTALAALAVARGCARLELSVLHWNPARGFYHHLGMRHLEEWLPYRLSGEALRALAAEA